MDIGIIGAGGIKDNLLFETYIRRAIHHIKEPVDHIILDGGSDRGISKLGMRFAEQHHLVSIQCRIEDINTLSRGLFVIWFGKEQKIKDVLSEADAMGHPIYEVRLDKSGIQINKYNGEHND